MYAEEQRYQNLFVPRRLSHMLSFVGDGRFCQGSESPRLGFRINEAKSRQGPSQYIEYLWVSINSLSYHVRLSEAREAEFRQCLVLFQLGKAVEFILCLQLLGLMASVMPVVRLGLFTMRGFQLPSLSAPQSESYGAVHCSSPVVET